MTTAKIRLRRVRFKDGRTIEVFHRPDDLEIDKKFKASAASAMEGTEMAGYAIVAWRKNGGSFCAWNNSFNSQVASGQVPQYVKDMLILETAADWAEQ